MKDICSVLQFLFTGKEFQAVIISTVHTNNGTLWRPGCTDIDLGFFTDEKLLNTAFTRAKSYIGVVGDPVGLCTIDQCQKIWHDYLIYCDSTTNCDLLAEGGLQQIEIEMAEFNMEISRILKMEDILRGNAVPMDNNYREQTQQYVHIPSNEPNADSSPQQVSEPKEKQTRRRKLKDPVKEETDLILRYLAKQSMEETQCETQVKYGNAKKEISQNKQVTSVIHVKYIDFAEESDMAFIDYKPDNRRLRSKHKVSGNDYNDEFSSDSASDSEDDNLPDDEEMNDLLQSVQSYPDSFKQCMMKIKSQGHMYAMVKDQSSHVKEICISSHRNRGRSFDNDEVIVEIMEGTDDGNGRPKGKVLGIVKSHTKMRYRKIVCMADPNNHSIMIPRKKELPKIYTLLQKRKFGTHLEQKKGHVKVYRFTKDCQPVHDYNVPIDYENSQRQLFLVRYLKWREGFTYPLGIVIQEIPIEDIQETGFHILDEECYVPPYYTEQYPEVIMLERQYEDNYQIPDEIIQERYDLRLKIKPFTIDSTTSQDLDDALSIDTRVTGENVAYIVGVHIADVSHFVEQNTQLDKKIFCRGATFYPSGGDPIHMIPNQLSTNLCSLLPDKDRLAISVLFKFSEDGQVLERFCAKETVIRSLHKLSYSGVECILDDVRDIEVDHTNMTLNMQLKVMYRIACGLRQERKSKESLLDRTDNDKNEESCFKSRLLVEEFMVMANKSIAEYLLTEYPECTPLKRQLPPNSHEMKLWKDEHGVQGSNAFALQEAVNSVVCKCPQNCVCGLGNVGEGENENSDNIEIENKTVLLLQDEWAKLLVARTLQDVCQIVGDAKRYPQQARALIAWRKIQVKSAYVCSGTSTESDRKHYSLNMKAYTHFSSPIRRYIDIVVHRLVKTALKRKACPYTMENIDNICTHCTEVSMNADRYERQTRELRFTLSLESSPRILYPIVECIQEQSFKLLFPSQPEIPFNCQTIAYRALDLGQQPAFPNGPNIYVHLMWLKRVYDIAFRNSSRVTSSQLNNPAITMPTSLNPDRFIVKVSVKDWQNLLQSICVQDWAMTKCCLEKLHQTVGNDVIDIPYLSDISCEMLPGNNSDVYKEHFCKFEICVQPNQVMQVQVAPQIDNGLLVPSIQLLNLTATLDVCLEHRKAPLHCFSQEQQNPHMVKPTNIRRYMTQWLDTLVMESAYCTVEESEGAIIHNVEIQWKTCQDYEIHGYFILSLDECKRHYLTFSHDVIETVFAPKNIAKDWLKEFHKKLQVGECSQQKVTPHGFFCVRIKESQFSHSNAYEKLASWVGHFHINTVNVSQDKVAVTMKLHQSALAFPKHLLEQPTNQLSQCTVEWLNKPLPDV